MDVHPIPVTHHTETSYGKVIFVCILFLLSLVAFVTQTELTSYLYQTGYNEPFLLLYLTHGSWWTIWPLQVLCIAVYKTGLRYSRRNAYRSLEEQDTLIAGSRNGSGAKKIKKWRGFKNAFKSSVVNQHRNIFKTSEIVYELNDSNYLVDSDVSITHLKEFTHSLPIRYVFTTSAWIMVVLNIAGCSWYFALTLTTSSDVTAIYNCSAFTAYAFAIIFLKERFSILKASSVVFAIIGVVIVTYSGSNDSPSSGDSETPYRLAGNVIIAMGAVLYGLYEVIYKKFLCPPSNTVSSRRQAAFSSFTMSTIGLMTALFLWIPLFAAQIFGFHKFEFPSSFKLWMIVIGSVLSNIIFSVSFLSLISLTSPVLSSVASLVTILFVGVAEWYIFHIGLNFLQIIGDLMVAIGFIVLTIASWNEVSEEDADDDDNTTDIESVYSSTTVNAAQA